jgi:hypothetical protein
MGVRYLALIGDPHGDRLRPKKIDPRSSDHLTCKPQIQDDYREIVLEKKIEDNKCCNNLCLFVIYNLTHSNLWNDEILCINKCKDKYFYVIYVVNNNSDISHHKCDLINELIKRNLNHNGIILKEEDYNMLMHKKLSGITLLQSTKTLEENHKKNLKEMNKKILKEKRNPDDDMIRYHISFYKLIRNNMGEIIRYYLELEETRNGAMQN